MPPLTSNSYIVRKDSLDNNLLIVVIAALSIKHYVTFQGDFCDAKVHKAFVV